VQEVTKRVVSGACIAPLILCILLFLPAPFLGLFLLLVVSVATHEVLTISATRHKLVAGVLAVSSALPLYLHSFSAYALWVLISPMAYLAFRMAESGEGPDRVNEEIAKAVTGVVCTQVFIVLALSYFVRLKELNLYYPAIVVLAVWATDTAAYFIGKKFGKKRLAPRISPRKTWAGLLAAMGGGVVVILIFGSMLQIAMWECVLVGALIGLLGQLGDILESVFKRVYGVKDSSSLIPGHGGMLDRIDSFLFTAPFAYHYLAGFSS
jgi:phosphatidate cytidylyltransferase